MFLISSIKKSICESDLSVVKGKSDSNVLPLSINKRCLVQKRLKDFTIYFEVSSRFVIVKKGGIVYRESFYHLKESLIEPNSI